MKIIIQNGATIIKTGDPNGGVKNKYNKPGVSKHIGHNDKIQYRAEIQVNKKTYYLGLRNTPEEAHELRLEAEKALELLKKSKDSSDLGKLLFSISRISDSLGKEAEEILYIENEEFIRKFS